MLIKLGVMLAERYNTAAKGRRSIAIAFMAETYVQDVLEARNGCGGTRYFANYLPKKVQDITRLMF